MNAAPEDTVDHLVKEAPKESRSPAILIYLELRMDVDDESRGYNGEQTSLSSE